MSSAHKCSRNKSEFITGNKMLQEAIVYCSSGNIYRSHRYAILQYHMYFSMYIGKMKGRYLGYGICYRICTAVTVFLTNESTTRNIDQTDER